MTKKGYKLILTGINRIMLQKERRKESMTVKTGEREKEE